MLLSLCVGCGGGLPALQAPNIDPASATEEAMKLYDADGSGSLSSDELQSCPGLAQMIKAYDSDSDSEISRTELEERLQKFVNSRAALVPLSAKITLNNQPLVGAQVRFVPEPYFQDHIKPASGVTSVSGSARMAVAPDDLPENQRKFRGVQFGTYRVEITHPEIDIPARYNTETTLGYETVLGRPNVGFRLKGTKKKK